MRIATYQHIAAVALDAGELHPTFASGEDRNFHLGFLVFLVCEGLHPTFASGEDRNNIASAQPSWSARALHPTFASGEDRNYGLAAAAAVIGQAAPDVRVG